ncbi:MAG: copper chaperone PCu(A)C, partial [Janthinobacterium lividum]
MAALPLPSGKPVTLAPGSYHLMLMGLVYPLHRGDSFPLTVTFAHALAATVQVRVEGPSPTHPGIPDAMPGMAM